MISIYKFSFYEILVCIFHSILFLSLDIVPSACFLFGFNLQFHLLYVCNNCIVLWFRSINVKVCVIALNGFLLYVWFKVENHFRAAKYNSHISIANIICKNARKSIDVQRFKKNMSANTIIWTNVRQRVQMFLQFFGQWMKGIASDLHRDLDWKFQFGTAIMNILHPLNCLYMWKCRCKAGTCFNFSTYFRIEGQFVDLRIVVRYFTALMCVSS